MQYPIDVYICVSVRVYKAKKYVSTACSLSIYMSLCLDVCAHMQRRAPVSHVRVTYIFAYMYVYQYVCTNSTGRKQSVHGSLSILVYVGRYIHIHIYVLNTNMRAEGLGPSDREISTQRRASFIMYA